MQKFLSLATIVFLFLTILIVGESHDSIIRYLKQQPKCEHKEEYKVLNDWQIFVMALAEVESEYETSVVNPKVKATGLLQITEIFVKESNRIIGYDVYSMEDAKDPIKSLEIFHIVNNHRNPEQLISKAIKLHNPTAGKWYEKRVRQEIKRFKVREKVRKELIENYNLYGKN